MVCSSSYNWHHVEFLENNQLFATTRQMTTENRKIEHRPLKNLLLIECEQVFSQPQLNYYDLDYPHFCMDLYVSCEIFWEYKSLVAGLVFVTYEYLSSIPSIEQD